MFVCLYNHGGSIRLFLQLWRLYTFVCPIIGGSESLYVQSVEALYVCVCS